MAFKSAEAHSKENESPIIALHARQLKTTGAATSFTSASPSSAVEASSGPLDMPLCYPARMQASVAF
eukprot:SAG31_NODE_38203_length_298_cov_0.768844_1_plen_66_part_10